MGVDVCRRDFLSRAICGKLNVVATSSYISTSPQSYVSQSTACLLTVQIVWEDRLLGDIGNDVLVTVDGTDFMIPQLTPFWTGWFSHKFKGPGLRYEVCLCILTGDIVLVHGPFPCGKYADITIFRHALKHFLGEGERAEADSGYIHESPGFVVVPDALVGEEHARMKSRIRSRQETVNKRFKQWGCLKQVFRHKEDLARQHSSCFRAVAVITQLAIDNGEPLFSVAEFRDHPL